MLDGLDKVVNIIFRGVIGAVIAIFTLTGKWDDFFLKQEAHCLASASQYERAVIASEEILSENFLQKMQERCDYNSVDETRQAVQEERAVGNVALADRSDHSLEASFDDLLRQAIASGLLQVDDEGVVFTTQATEAEVLVVDPLERDGFVAMGFGDKDPAQGNFRLSGGGAVSEDDLGSPGLNIVARWPVNLRLNTEGTLNGGNPSIGIVEEGQCLLTVAEPIFRRGQFWAPVSFSECE